MTDSLSRDIAQFPLLAALEAPFRDRAAQALRWQHFDSGATIIDRDEQQADVHFLARGQLMAVYWTRDGREIIFTAMSQGHYFGELTALDGAPRSLCVHARSAADLAVMPAATFRALIAESPAFRDRVLHGLTHRIRDLTERMCQLTALPVPQRVRSFVLRHAVEAGCLHPGAVLRDFPTHAEIAARIGANREAVSRALSALRRDGIVLPQRGGLTILNPDRLVDEDL